MWVVNDDGRSRFPWRTVESMKKAIADGDAKSVSIHAQPVRTLCTQFRRLYLTVSLCIVVRVLGNSPPLHLFHFTRGNAARYEARFGKGFAQLRLSLHSL